LARALNGMRRRIRLVIEARTRMLRGVGHDLRAPLTRLKLRVERMGDGSQKDASQISFTPTCGSTIRFVSALLSRYRNEGRSGNLLAKVLQRSPSDVHVQR